MSISPRTIAGVTAASLTLIGSVFAGPVSAQAAAVVPASHADGCYTVSKSVKLVSSGVRVDMDVAGQVDGYDDETSFSAEAFLGSTTGRTLKKTAVFYYQFDDASAKWQWAKRQAYTAPKNGTGIGIYDDVENQSYKYDHHQFRVILNAQGHNFVSPWLKLGTGTDIC